MDRRIRPAPFVRSAAPGERTREPLDASRVQPDVAAAGAWGAKGTVQVGQTMNCGEFLAGYTDYRDGTVSWEREEDFLTHMEDCGSCARYDRVVRRGADVLRGLPELEVSDDFAERLQHRLYHVDEERSYAGRRAAAGTAMTTLGVAAMIALAAWVPMMLPRGAAEPAPALAVVDAVSTYEALPLHAVAEPEYHSTGLAARLEEVGVKVYPLPYRDLLYGGGSLATLASYDGGDLRHD